MGIVMQFKSTFSSRRRVVSRIVVASTLIGTSFLVGLATTASANPLYHLVITTPGSATDVNGVALATQPVVTVEDGSNTPVAGDSSTVTATVTSGGTAFVTNGISAPAVNGVANFRGLALNATDGAQTLTFSDGTDVGVTSATITVTVGAPVKLALTTAPALGDVNTLALAPQPVVSIEDSGGNVVTTDTSLVTAAFLAGGTSLANATKLAVSGVAAFSGLAMTAAIDNSYNLHFSDGSLTPVNSNPILVTGPSTKLVIATAPSVVATSGTALAVQPVINLEDAAGFVVRADTSTVSAAITTGGVSVTAPITAAVAGVATFAGLALNATAGTYTLTFTDGALASTVSAPIVLSIGAASKLVVTTEPSILTSSGVALVQQPVVKAEDSGGDVVTTVTTGAVTATISSGVGGALSAGATANFVAGVATFSGLTLTGVTANSYTLSYSGDSLTFNDVTAIKVSPQATLVVSTVAATYGRTFVLQTTGGSGTGAVSFSVANGTATGCAVTGTALKSFTPGHCVVTATKASDTTYASATSVATTVTFTKLPIPGAVRIGFAANSYRLSAGARNQINSLVKKLTTHSVVSITGYAKGNLGLARRRASIVAQFLAPRVRVKIQFHWDRRAATSSALIVTRSQ